MFKKLMLAGLMTATVAGGIAPAHAQWRKSDDGEQRGRADRPVGETPQRGPGWQGVQRQQRPESRGADRQARSDNRPGVAADGPRARAWRVDGAGRPAPVQPAPVQQGDRRDWRDENRRDQRTENRRDWRGDRRDARQDWRDDRRDDRQRDRWNADRRDNGDWNDRRRFDDRTRWSTQRRWDSGWRQDRRYDWSSYRSRYGDRYRVGRYYAPRGWTYGYRRFSTGIFLSGLLYSNNYWLSDPYSYRLPPAYGTLRWVRYYDDALLVDVRDGYVVDVIHDFFW